MYWFHLSFREQRICYAMALSATRLLLLRLTHSFTPVISVLHQRAGLQQQPCFYSPICKREVSIGYPLTRFICVYSLKVTQEHVLVKNLQDVYCTQSKGATCTGLHVDLFWDVRRIWLIIVEQKVFLIRYLPVLVLRPAGSYVKRRYRQEDAEMCSKMD